MSEYIITCDEETASRIRNDVDSMKRIVRCRDCSEYIQLKGYAMCGYFGGDYVEIEPDGFCAWGERGESE